MILSGPAGTGKSRACLEKVHACCLRWPGCRWLIARKTRTSLSESGLVTLETKVFPENSPIAEGAGRSHRQVYTYPNGSEIVVGGLDKPSKIMSTEYDGAYVQETIELTENDWEAITTRLRNGVMPFQQIIADTNPDTPSHWIKLRANRGDLTMLESRHEDNPTLWDRDRGEWTPSGSVYLGKLDRLTGARKERLRHGRWVQAEGVVYEAFDRVIHVVKRFEIPAHWRRVRSIDFGYTNPFVCFDDRTEILTRDGWVNLADLTVGTQVATLHPEDHRLEWQQPTAYIETWYEGPMIVSEPREQGCNFSVTPNHRMVVANRKSGRWRLEPASRLGELGDSAIPTGWKPPSFLDGDEPFVLSRTNSRGRESRIETTRREFARFLGLWLAEGSLYEQRVQSTGDRRYFVRIAQKYDIDQTREIIAGLGVGWSEHADKNGVVDFRIQNVALFSFLEQTCGRVKSREKRIPSFAFDWGADSLGALLNGLILGDGRHRTHDDSGRRIATDAYFTSSTGLADDVQTLACLLGIASVIAFETVETKFSRGPITQYIVRFHVASRAKIDKLPIIEQPYRGYVRCVTVPNGILVVRRGGRPMACGNCQWWAVDSDGRMVLYREIYMTGRTIAVHARKIKELSAGEKYEATVADHDASERASLHEAGIHTVPAQKAIRAGIQAVEDRLAVAGDGRPRLTIFADALAERDPVLDEAKLPCSTVEEFDCYVWPKGQDGKAVKEVPVDLHNHGMDGIRYACMYANKPRLPMFIKLN